MHSSLQKTSGTSLIIFTVLMFFTMVLHPAGGSFEHLLAVTKMVVITHGIALFAVPFAAVGFWGLTKTLGTDHFLSLIAFAFVIMALLAVTMAAAANGIVLPVFIQKYKDAAPETIEALRPLLKYNASVNLAFDYIYTVAFATAIAGWSIVIIQTKKLPLWIAVTGIGLTLFAAGLLITGFSPGSLQVFRLFVMVIIAWIISAGILLRRFSD